MASVEGPVPSSPAPTSEKNFLAVYQNDGTQKSEDNETRAKFEKVVVCNCLIIIYPYYFLYIFVYFICMF